jgi:methylmalonyl-CoA/ethylmalonyl-CoA epimerase
MIKAISHIGVAVKNLEEAIEFFHSTLGLEASNPTIGSVRKVCMVHVGGAKVELIEPLEDGVINKFLEKHGQGVHHICFEVDDIELELKSLVAKGIELVDKEPRRGAEGKVAFLHPRASHGVLIELVQKIQK